MRNIAIIPARSGSKGLPDKNIMILNDKPLLAYSIDSAIKSECFCEVMVSTDSEKYAEIAKECGASVPFLRSANTASDTASSWDMIDEVLDGYKKIGKEFDTFCLLQPTSPLRTAEDIIGAYKMFEEHASFAVVSVCEAEHSPLWCGHLPPNMELAGFISENSTKQRQQGEKYYRLNGAIYIVDCKKYKNDKYLYQKGSFAFIMPQSKSIDIDNEIDFELARIILSRKN